MKRKILSAVIALLTLTANSICMNVSAYEYIEDYDVNMDYQVNIRDVVFINKILSGMAKASYPEFLDLNGNGIADEVDSKMILYYITGKNVYYNQQ